MRSWTCLPASFSARILEENTFHVLLTHFMPLISFIPPKKIRKPEVFWCFQGVAKEVSGMKLVNWLNVIVWFPLLLFEIFSIMCIVIICFPVDDVITFKINLSYQVSFSRCFPKWPKTSGQKLKYIKNKRGFKMK